MIYFCDLPRGVAAAITVAAVTDDLLVYWFCYG